MNGNKRMECEFGYGNGDQSIVINGVTSVRFELDVIYTIRMDIQIDMEENTVDIEVKVNGLTTKCLLSPRLPF